MFTVDFDHLDVYLVSCQVPSFIKNQKDITESMIVKEEDAGEIYSRMRILREKAF